MGERPVLSSGALDERAAGPRRPHPAAAGARSRRWVAAYAAKTRERADEFAAVLEEIAENGVPSVEDCTPWEELREAHLARLAAQRPAVA